MSKLIRKAKVTGAVTPVVTPAVVTPAVVTPAVVTPAVAVATALKDAEDVFTKAVEEPIWKDEEQEIIEVSQDEVKVALKALISKRSSIIATLYLKHEEYNKEYFKGILSIPLITIEKMSNKTLGNYNAGADTTGIENHIELNNNFVALNTETRIEETLRHEMIHQYQDEVLYEKKANKGSTAHSGQKRPVEWHNVDFRDYAKIVDIPANGKHCTGNPAIMPEAKSYNRKFACGCIASNGYKMTIWSTREVDATCNICGEEYVELEKATGKTIAVNQSDVEKAGEDAIKIKMGATYVQFNNFQDKINLTNVAKALKVSKVDYKEGIYQKGHNAYAKGYRYWIAWNMPEDIKAKLEGGIK